MADIPKPGDFFIGLAEFFGSLAPGTVLVALLWRLEILSGFDCEPQNLHGFDGGAIVAALIIGGYLAGNFVSVLGATLDSSYDAVRKLRYPPGSDKAFQKAKALCEAELGESPPMNAYQWARAVLSIEHREGYDEVARLEAASKLFRSMVVVFLVVAVAAAYKSQLNASMAGIAGAVLAFWPYFDRRYKSTETAYRLVIVVRARRAHSAGESSC